MHIHFCSLSNNSKNHAIYQNDEQVPFNDKEVEPVLSVRMNIYQINTI